MLSGSGNQNCRLPDHLRQWLSKFDAVGKTTRKIRNELSEGSLVQRNLEIEAERLRLEDAITHAAENQNNPDWQSFAEICTVQIDNLLRESDSIEAVLRKKYRYRGGGRFLIESDDNRDRIFEACQTVGGALAKNKVFSAVEKKVENSEGIGSSGSGKDEARPEDDLSSDTDVSSEDIGDSSDESEAEESLTVPIMDMDDEESRCLLPDLASNPEYGALPSSDSLPEPYGQFTGADASAPSFVASSSSVKSSVRGSDVSEPMKDENDADSEYEPYEDDDFTDMKDPGAEGDDDYVPVNAYDSDGETSQILQSSTRRTKRRRTSLEKPKAMHCTPGSVFEKEINQQLASDDEFMRESDSQASFSEASSNAAINTPSTPAPTTSTPTTYTPTTSTPTTSTPTRMSLTPVPTSYSPPMSLWPPTHSSSAPTHSSSAPTQAPSTPTSTSLVPTLRSPSLTVTSLTPAFTSPVPTLTSPVATLTTPAQALTRPVQTLTTPAPMPTTLVQSLPTSLSTTPMAASTASSPARITQILPLPPITSLLPILPFPMPLPTVVSTTSSIPTPTTTMVTPKRIVPTLVPPIPSLQQTLPTPSPRNLTNTNPLFFNANSPSKFPTADTRIRIPLPQQSQSSIPPPPPPPSTSTNVVGKKRLRSPNAKHPNQRVPRGNGRYHNGYSREPTVDPTYERPRTRSRTSPSAAQAQTRSRTAPSALQGQYHNPNILAFAEQYNSQHQPEQEPQGSPIFKTLRIPQLNVPGEAPKPPAPPTPKGRKGRKPPKRKREKKKSDRDLKFEELEKNWKKLPSMWEQDGILKRLGRHFADQFGDYGQYKPVKPPRKKRQRKKKKPKDNKLDPRLTFTKLVCTSEVSLDHCSEPNEKLTDCPCVLKFARAKASEDVVGEDELFDYGVFLEIPITKTKQKRIGFIPCNENDSSDFLSAISILSEKGIIHSVCRFGEVREMKEQVQEDAGSTASKSAESGSDAKDKPELPPASSSSASIPPSSSSKDEVPQAPTPSSTASSSSSPGVLENGEKLSKMEVSSDADSTSESPPDKPRNADSDSELPEPRTVRYQTLRIQIWVHSDIFRKTMLRSELLCKSFMTVLKVAKADCIIQIDRMAFGKQTTFFKTLIQKNLQKLNLQLDTASLYESLRPQWRTKCEQPRKMKHELRKYQKMAVSWMLHVEKDEIHPLVNPLFFKFELEETDENQKMFWFNPYTGAFSLCVPSKIFPNRGGILAEEMGLGKTVECIALRELNQRTNWSDGSPAVEQRMRALAPIEDSVAELLESTPVLFETAATLIICPMSIAYQWQDEINKHADHLTIMLYDGKRKKKDPPSAEVLANCDIVLTTYQVLREEVDYSKNSPYTFRRTKRYKIPETPLLQVGWHRVMLDEAQFVENTVALTAKMARRIRATHRWCVTGTPMGKHGLQDIYGLMVFLDQIPWTENRLWNKAVALPYFNDEPQQLYVTLKRLLWRHSKNHVADELNLPSLHSELIALRFSPVEDEYYKRLLVEQKDIVEQDAQLGKLREGDAAVARLDTLRQACCHPQVSRRSLVGEETTFLSMAEIMKKMELQAADELTSYERELCRRLNEIGCYYIELIEHELDRERRYRKAPPKRKKKKPKSRARAPRQQRAPTSPNGSTTSQSSASTATTLRKRRGVRVPRRYMDSVDDSASSQQSQGSTFQPGPDSPGNSLDGVKLPTSSDVSAISPEPSVAKDSEPPVVSAVQPHISQQVPENVQTRSSAAPTARNSRQRKSVDSLHVKTRSKTDGPSMQALFFMQMDEEEDEEDEKDDDDDDFATFEKREEDGTWELFCKADDDVKELVMELEDKAIKAFVEAWRIADAGIKYDSDKSDALVKTADVETKNSQVREWRVIELVTTHNLIKLYERKLRLYQAKSGESDQASENKLDEVENETCDEKLKKLKEQLKLVQKQHVEIREELVEVIWIKLTDLRVLLVQYEEVIVPERFKCACQEAKEIYFLRKKLGVTKFNKDRNAQKRMDEADQIIDFQRRKVQACQRYIVWKRNLNSLQEHVLKKMQHYPQVVLNKEKLLVELLSKRKRETNQIEATKCSKGNACPKCRASGKADIVSKKMPPTVIGVFMKMAQNNMKELGDLIKMNPGLFDAMDEENFAELLQDYRSKWNSYVDSQGMFRTFREIHEVKGKIKKLENEYSLLTYKLDQECTRKYVRWEQRESVRSTLKTGATKMRTRSEAQYRHVTYLRHKFKLLSSAKIFNMNQNLPEQDEKNTSAFRDPLEPVEVTECAICRNKVMHPVLTDCAHLFCENCILTWMKVNSRCAVCRHFLRSKKNLFQITPALFSSTVKPSVSAAESVSAPRKTRSSSAPSSSAPSSSKQRLKQSVRDHVEIDAIEIKGSGQYGTKIEALVRHIIWLGKNDPSAKSLVFSQWTQMLDFIKKALNDNLINCVTLSGTARDRAKHVSVFQNDSNVRVLLMSLRTDASGLTLTQATHVFLLEPSLNPAVEDQAINRVHRIGQLRETFVHRFYMKDSIEEKIFEMQEEKRRIHFEAIRRHVELQRELKDSERNRVITPKNQRTGNFSQGMATRQKEELTVREMLGLYQKDEIN